MTAAIVVAGGRGSRLGGTDKAALDIAGRPLVDHVFTALAGCDPIVAVGPDSLVRPGVHVVREDPPFGGPVAAIAAALGSVDDAAETYLLACDLPRAGAIVARLSTERLGAADGVLLTDSSDRAQWLAGRYRVSALRAAVVALGDPNAASVRRLLTGLVLRTVPDTDGASIDLDTPDDVRAYRRTIEGMNNP